MTILTGSAEVIASYLATNNRENDMTDDRSALAKYKANLAKSILDYKDTYDLCSEGIRDFCRDNDIPLKAERDITITITFRVTDAIDVSTLEDEVDDYCRSITEVSGMGAYIDHNIEDENYRVEIGRER